MSNIVTHSHGSQNKKNSKSLLVVIVTLVIIMAALFGLNYFLSSKTKNNSSIVEKVTDNNYTMGDPNAKIKIVEYADFQCPACSVFSAVFPEVFNYINSKYGSSTLSITYKYFPLVSIHGNALLSAYSAEAAKNQGKFWEMNHKLFETQNDWAEALDAKSKIEGYARDMGLDMAKFIQDRDSEATKNTVNAGLLEATKLGLTHTPFVFMNGEEMVDLQLTADYIEKAIEGKLKALDPQAVSENSNLNPGEAGYVQKVTN